MEGYRSLNWICVMKPEEPEPGISRSPMPQIGRDARLSVLTDHTFFHAAALPPHAIPLPPSCGVLLIWEIYSMNAFKEDYLNFDHFHDI